MTTDPIRPGLHPFSHLKAGPTTFSSKSTALPASSSTPPPAQFSHRPQLLKNPGKDEQISGTSDRATTALIRRVLCPQTGSYSGATSPYAPEELLPPLTSSNDVDRQLYALIAIIIKEFVTSWYSKITSDPALVNEAVQVVAHCTRALEQRLREIDVAQLILDELPALVEAHIASYRLAKEQANLSGFSPSSREIYHALNPHPGLWPVPDPCDPETIVQQRENEAVYRRLLADGVLAVLLPTEELENACLRALVTDILADLVLGNEVSGKICEGWFLWESITKLLDTLSRDKPQNRDSGVEKSPQNRLQKFGLLSPKDSQSNRSSSTTQSQTSNWIWHLLQFLHETIQDHVLPPTLLPNLLLASREALFPQNARLQPVLGVNRSEEPTVTLRPTPTPQQPLTVPITSTTTTTAAIGSRAPTPAHTVIGTPSLSPGPQQHAQQEQQRPSGPEIALIRRKCAVGILSLIPRPIARHLLGISRSDSSAESFSGPILKNHNPDQEHDSDPEDSASPLNRTSAEDTNVKDHEESLLLNTIETDILDLFADEYSNKHLIYSILETVLARLLPELSDRSIAELMEDRGVFLNAAAAPTSSSLAS
ncbi:hypothetical protein ARAM_004165 [Aspergillus rambellii]|uniref:PXA domain-containing protein n=1 Tax=Aspergillus rambellii TaxID=308745 RepID=A0A0F8V3U4_9EURO|nr:hypothetical protein ARAM_004165 [Aspergillus rambellii]